MSIARRYNARVAQDQSPLPHIWLLSDARNNATLEDSLATLPSGSGFIYRHYHLGAGERRRRFDELKAVAKQHNHIVILSGSTELACEWSADGVYGPADKLGTNDDLLRLATAHNGDEIQAANRIEADAVLLSPVFPTRSHPDASVLGPFGFSVLAQQADMPVIALGGMTRKRAEANGIQRWAAIDGLS